MAETLGSERYGAVIEGLHRLVEGPPWTEASQAAAAQVLPTLVANDLDRMRKRVQQGGEGD